ncbi:MAG: Dihydroorotate dehydrogenase (quinone), mitochondrial [Geoglossum simile]|nr:MAG: Dihydroorotate dehydrogenase (quinone), mitochondrial [Geoglossum simile]
MALSTTPDVSHPEPQADLLFLGLGWYYVTDTRAGVHRWLVVPALRWWYRDAEEAHEAGTKALRALWELGLHPREREDVDGGVLEVEVFGQMLSNPIATSAGIDKHAQVPTALLALGPAIVEVGGTTPLPQDGNPKPRVFRLPSQNAIINRYGFNSEGADVVARRLRHRVRKFAYAMGFGTDDEAEKRILDGEAGVPPGSLVPGRLMAIQITKNKQTPEKDVEAVVQDYVYCMQQLGKYADIIVVNVSSPNTPGLRTLQRVEPLTKILKGVVDAAAEVPRRVKPRIMVKVSPDEDGEDQVRGICEALVLSGVDGVIVGNTTKQRPDPLPKGPALPPEESALISEQGGYSGPQMFERTLVLVKRYRKRLDEDLHRNPDKPPKSLEISASIAPMGGLTLSGDPETSVSLRPASKECPESEHLSVTNENGEQGPAIQPPTEPLRDSKESTPELVSDAVPKSLPSVRRDTSSRKPKVIFATGGITNGKQALEMLEAGADIAMIYTTIVFGGAGTVTRIKKEMRDEMSRKAGK